MTSFSSASGKENWEDTSVNSSPARFSNRFLLFRQSSLRRPVMLNRYVCTVYPALQSRRDTAKASPPLLPGPANTMKRVAVVQRLFNSAAIAFAARSIKSVDETGSCSMVYLSNSLNWVEVSIFMTNKTSFSFVFFGFGTVFG